MITLAETRQVPRSFQPRPLGMGVYPMPSAQHAEVTRPGTRSENVLDSAVKSVADMPFAALFRLLSKAPLNPALRRANTTVSSVSGSKLSEVGGQANGDKVSAIPTAVQQSKDDNSDFPFVELSHQSLRETLADANSSCSCGGTTVSKDGAPPECFTLCENRVRGERAGGSIALELGGDESWGAGTGSHGQLPSFTISRWAHGHVLRSGRAYQEGVSTWEGIVYMHGGLAGLRGHHQPHSHRSSPQAQRQHSVTSTPPFTSAPLG